MRIAFLTEMGFTGKVPANHPNMRTEFAWMHALDAVHYPIDKYDTVLGYDHVFIIFPKGMVFLNATGSKIANGINPASELLKSPIVSTLKHNNVSIHYIQEGATWWFNDYDINDQILFYNFLYEVDSIFSHNEFDTKFYKGLFPNKIVRPIQTLMFDYQIKHIQPIPQDKCIVGGNFARWYGGFQSYVVAQEFEVPIWTQTSHATREHENQIDGLNHLPRLFWDEWMIELSKFKYAVHLMPTVAAGTFSLNCAYFGIPCIGNIKVDTQRILHPNLSVDVDDVETARKLARQLKVDNDFYMECSKQSRNMYESEYTPMVWKQKFTNSMGVN